MSDIVSLEARRMSDLMPSHAAKYLQLTDIVQETFEKWGYFPLIPSLYEHKNLSIVDMVEQPFSAEASNRSVRQSLSKEILSVIRIYQSEMTFPVRFWFGGPVAYPDEKSSGKVIEDMEMGIECVGCEPLLSDSEVISMAHEILKSLQFRNVRLVLGNKNFLRGLEEAGIKGANSKVALLRGDRDILSQAGSFSSDKVCQRSLEDLKLWTNYVREFGYKDSIQYDLNPFLESSEYESLIFRIESGYQHQPLISGGRRKVGETETVGFSIHIQDMLGLAKLGGMPLFSPKVDFLMVNRKKSRKSTFEIMKVLREHGYSVVTDYSDRNRDELLDYAQKAGILNLMIIGDEDAALNEVRLLDVTDKISTKISISEIFDEKSGLNKLLRYHKRLEIGK